MHDVLDWFSSIISIDSVWKVFIIDILIPNFFRYELLQVQRRTREDKKLYRRAIKEKEERQLAQTGRRRLPKAERDSGDATYGSYKLAKAKLKLIEALLSKPGPLLFWNYLTIESYLPYTPYTSYSAKNEQFSVSLRFD